MLERTKHWQVWQQWLFNTLTNTSITLRNDLMRWQGKNKMTFFGVESCWLSLCDRYDKRLMVLLLKEDVCSSVDAIAVNQMPWHLNHCRMLAMTMICIPVKQVFSKPFRLQTVLRAMQHPMMTTKITMTSSPLLDLWRRQRLHSVCWTWSFTRNNY